MTIKATLYRLAVDLPQPIKAMLRSKRLSVLRQMVVPRQPLVTGTIDYEGHAFEFTAPVKIFDKAKSRGVENRICRLILAEVPVGGTAVDVGANFGFLTRVMAAATGATGRVVSFEADGEIADVLTSSLRSNRCTWVEVVGRAVGTGDRVGLDAHEPTLGGVDFMKIDVDGPELDVLKSGRELLERDHPVLVVEINRQGQEIYDLLKSVGYTEFMGMSNEPVVAGEWPSNLIASIRPVRIPRVPSSSAE